MTRVYRLLVHRKRLGLVTQHYMDVRSLPCRILHGDVSAKDFNAAWEELPWQTRWLYTAALPIAAVYFFLVLTREHIARELETSDLPSREEILQRDGDPGLDPVVRDARDAHLIQFLNSLVVSEGSSAQRIGVVWGAAHMPPVTRALLDDGYRVVESEWETVFEV